MLEKGSCEIESSFSEAPCVFGVCHGRANVKTRDDTSDGDGSHVILAFVYMLLLLQHSGKRKSLE